MVFTNVIDQEDFFGGLFGDQVRLLIEPSSNVTIASGYVSLDAVEKYAPSLEHIASSGGVARLLVGMAFYEGLSQKKLTRLINLSSNLAQASNGSGVFVPYARKYHGKIYQFQIASETKYYIGSSNFSSSGLSGNMEATAPILDPKTRNSIKAYIDYLFSEEVSKTIDQLDIVVPGSTKYNKRISSKTLDELERYIPGSISTAGLSFFDLDLERLTEMHKSSLNVYFGKGRWTRATGKITPRDWYEIAIIAQAHIIRNPIYPHGNFKAYTDDGYVIPMAANGQNDKNIQSQGSLTLLGMWLKSRLQNSGALVPLTPITLDTLEAYGRSSLRFYKISDGKYYLDFSTAETPELTRRSSEVDT